MSIAFINAVLSLPDSVSGSRRLVLVVLADAANDAGECWPSIATIAQRCAVSRDYAKVMLRELEQDGFLKIVHRRAEGKDLNMPNIYRLTLQGREAGIPTGREAETPTVGRRASPGREAETPTGREAGLPRVGRRASPKPPVNPQLNHQLTARAQNQEQPPPPPAANLSKDLAEVSTAYEKNIGALTPMIADSIQDALADTPAEWIIDSISEAVKNNARKWSYCQAILKRWRVEGRSNGKTKTADKPQEEVFTEVWNG